MADRFFDTNIAAARCNRMWRRLGGQFEAKAYEYAKQGLCDSSLKAARMADVCFWQATGEIDTIAMKDVLPKERADA